VIRGVAHLCVRWRKESPPTCHICRQKAERPPRDWEIPTRPSVFAISREMQPALREEGQCSPGSVAGSPAIPRAREVDLTPLNDLAFVEILLPSGGPLKTNIIDLPVSVAAIRRGRRRKPALILRPCSESFDVVAGGVIALAAQTGSWAAPKERLRSQADREKAFAPATPKVLGYLLEHINRAHGFDWHSAKTIADELGLTIRTVERAPRARR